MPSKYGNRKTSLNGVEFDSHKEAQRYAQLRLLERAGRITNLRCQVKYILIPAQRDERGSLLERECSYVADFVYFDLTLGREVVEDSVMPLARTAQVMSAPTKAFMQAGR